MTSLQLPRVIAVVGPTAAGKSALGLGLARALGGAVLNADSMQLYRGMDVGTAKPTPAEQADVPHHLLDVWDVREPASVAAYQQLAVEAISQLHTRGVPPILVGGSGLYVRAALGELDFPGTDPLVRAGLEAELAEGGAASLHARLAERDPAAAAAIPATNGRRIVRALEVTELTGAPLRASLPGYDQSADSLQLGVDVPDLDDRIAARVDRMWTAGLVEEVHVLVERGLREGRTASRALGYAQVLAMLAGVLDEEAARAETVRATRRFARRQRSWFRRDPRIRWLAEATVDAALAALEH